MPPLYTTLPLFVVCGFLMAFALARAFARGLAAARDPSIRATPLPSWRAFDRVVWKRLAWEMPLFAGILAAVGTTVYRVNTGIMDPEDDWTTAMLKRVGLILWASVFTNHILALWLGIFAACLRWGPRSGSIVSFTLVAALVPILAYFIFACAWMTLAPGFSWDYCVMRPAGQWFRFGVLIPPALPFLLVGAWSARAAWKRARRLEDAWFLPED